MRASMEMHRHVDRGAAQERSAPKHNREERTERPEPEEPRHRTGNIKPTSKPPGEKFSCDVTDTCQGARSIILAGGRSPGCFLSPLSQ